MIIFTRQLKRFAKAVSWRVMVIGLSLLVTVFMLEIIVRLFFPQQLVLVRPDIWIPTDDGRGYQHQPNLDTVINTGERDVHLFTDEQGYRIGETLPLTDPDIRILALGDSFLAALQVNYENTMTALLENQLAAELGQTVRIVNTGIGGYNPNHYLIIACQELTRMRYDMVVAFIYAGNDVVDSRVNAYPPRSSHIKTLRLPRSLDREELSDAIFYPINNFLEANSHLFILLRRAGNLFFSRIGLTPYYVSNAILTSFSDSPAWANIAEIMAAVQVEAQQYNIPVVFVLIPTVYQVDEVMFDWYQTAFDLAEVNIDLNQPATRLTEELAKQGILLYDSTIALREAYTNNIDDLFGNYDQHLGINGHRVIAEYLQPLLLRMLETSTTSR